MVKDTVSQRHAITYVNNSENINCHTGEMKCNKYTCTRRYTLCIGHLVVTYTVFVQKSNCHEPPNMVWFLRS